MNANGRRYEVMRMGIFDIFHKKNMLQEVTECRNTPGGVLIDVRGRDEYNDGHIPGAINVPVNDIHKADRYIRKKDALVCVYCLSGMRAANAAAALRARGYTNVKNLGGIKKYHGKIER
ncbi:MAG: rhodanese-like domain-containing protein [Lentihominibacter sp.]